MNALILSDFSKVSCNAGRYAVDYFGEEPSNFYILNIDEFNFGSGVKRDNEIDSNRNKLTAYCRELEVYSDNLSHTFYPLLSIDNLINTLRKELTLKKIDLIVIGKASHITFNENEVPADHLYEVIRKIKTNILVVPDSTHFKRPEMLLLPVDFSVVSRSRVFRQIDHAGYVNSKKLMMISVDENMQSSQNLNSKKTEVIGFTKLFEEIHSKCDLILVIAKNLKICDYFFPSGTSGVSVPDNDLPILVLHE
ncbi:hypothetical protein [Christiangramia salexigens]|uniref:UspA domain-containing protein n=1 Tax=Christiangramia salexigens TaxID=1913577 RepID=A0A1L3J7F9_9FLAO|nr:hypothetical protein [Christiangramia salexigens]APG61033.1 hypothetical protein LPB144_11725 [Christiangramia salexigens]